MAEKKPTVLIADDHEIVRAGVRNLIESGGYSCCAEASNGREAVKMAEELLHEIQAMLYAGDCVIIDF